MIDSEDKAYFLGLMYADGNITHNGFEIGLSGESDTHIIQAFKTALQATHPIGKKFIEGYKTYYRLTISSSSQAREDLIRLGCFERKSLILKFPTEEQVPKYLIHHFIRGYFDGDGSVSHKINGQIHYSMISSVFFIDGLIKSLQENGIDLVIRMDKCHTNQVGYVSAGGVIAGKKIFDFMYKDATIFLKRKKAVFDSFFLSYLGDINARLFSQTRSKRTEVCRLFGLVETAFMMSKLTNDQQKDLIQLYKEKGNIQGTAKEFNCSHTMIKNVLRNHGILSALQ